MASKNYKSDIRILADLSLSGHRSLLRGFAEELRKRRPCRLHVQGSLGIDHELQGLLLLEPAQKLPKGIPLIAVGQRVPGGCHLDWDSRSQGDLAADHLVEMGYESFAFHGLGPSSDGLFHGFSQRLIRLGKVSPLRFDHDPQREGGFVEERQRLRQWLMSLPKPVGVLTPTDIRAMRVVDSSSDIGLRCPHDVGAMGCGGDDFLAQLSEVPLSSVGLDHHRLGRMAAHNMILGLEGKPMEDVVLSPIGVRARASTDLKGQEEDWALALRESLMEGDFQTGSPAVMARVLNCSLRTLERRMRKRYGMSPSAWLRKEKIEEAKRRLLEGEDRIGDISMALGYSNLGSMSTVFKRETGLSPRAFRKRNRALGDLMPPLSRDR